MATAHDTQRFIGFTNAKGELERRTEQAGKAGSWNRSDDLSGAQRSRSPFRRHTRQAIGISRGRSADSAPIEA